MLGPGEVGQPHHPLHDGTLADHHRLVRLVDADPALARQVLEVPAAQDEPVVAVGASHQRRRDAVARAGSVETVAVEHQRHRPAVAHRVPHHGDVPAGAEV